MNYGSGLKIANKKINIVDDLPVIMKEARNDLAKIAYNIRTKKNLQTRMRSKGVHLFLETRLNASDVWNVHKDIRFVWSAHVHEHVEVAVQKL